MKIEYKNLFKKMNQAQQENNKKEYIDIRNQLVEMNLKLVISRVKHIYGKFDEDLVEAGNEALITSIEKYDVNIGTEFSTYAVFWIDQAIHREMQKRNNWGGIPVYKYEKIQKAIKELSKNKQEPTIEEIAEATNIEIKELTQIMNLIKKPASFNYHPDDSETELLNIIDDTTEGLEEKIEKKMLKQEINKLLKNNLTPYYYNIIKHRYGLDGEQEKSLEEIARIFNVTRERIRQIETKALRILKNSEEVNPFRVYMDHPDKYKKQK